MKKLLLLFMIIFIVSLCINKNDTKMVFQDLMEHSNIYEITFVNNVSTNNFLNYFEDIKIIWIKPKINSLYKDKLVKYNKYYFKDISNEKNINMFLHDYINYIDKLGYKSEALKLKTSGVMIEKIKLYLTDKDLIYIKSILTDINIQNIS